MAKKAEPLLGEIQRGVRKVFSESVELSDYSEFFPNVRFVIGKNAQLMQCAEKFGTPLYVLDEDRLSENVSMIYQAFAKHLKRVSLFYAFKSNDLPHIIRVLKEKGVNADVSSLFELKLALKLGFKRIIFTAPYKSDEELKLVLEHGDRVVLNVDNLHELDKIIKLVSWRQPKGRLRICFRVSGNASGAGWDKFGLSLDELRVAAGLVMENKMLKWAGVHFHSSWNQTPDAHVGNIRIIGRYLKENFTPAELENLEFFDIGGGYVPVGSGELFSASVRGQIMAKLLKQHRKLPEMKEVQRQKLPDINVFAARVAKALNQEIFSQLGRDDLEVWLEPGRYLSSTSSCILLKVIYSKKGKLMTDGGINLIGGANFEFEFFPVLNITHPSLRRRNATIYGPLCDPEDHWGFSYFGDIAKEGDYLAVLNQGAYTFSTAWRWQRPTAAYAVISKTKAWLAKQTETFEQRYAGCKF